MRVSAYTIGEITVWLLLTAVLGFALGWLSRELVARSHRRPVDQAEAPSAPPSARAPAAPAPAAVPTPATSPAPVPAPAPVTPAATTVGPTPAPALVVPGPHPGSALPLSDGTAPSEAYVVKVSRSSKIFHAPSSPAYARTTAALWFTGPEAAEAAGFRPPKNG